MNGLTLDTGALIALERRDRRALRMVAGAVHDELVITVPAAVVVEWWRGQRGPAATLLEAFDEEPMTWELARVAGEALAAVGGRPSPVDAMVMASAARRGDRVLTSDIDDLQRFAGVFPAVRLFRV